MRFVDNQDGTITDTKTDLVWQKSGSNKPMNWYEAKEYAKTLGEGWRLPTIDELTYIVDYSKALTAAMDPVFGSHALPYWTCSVCAKRDNHYYVRCVRNGVLK